MKGRARQLGDGPWSLNRFNAGGVLDWDIIGPMIAMIVLVLTVGGVLVLRPIAKRLGDIAEIMLREKQEGAQGELRRMADLLETVSARMELLEERQDFTERLLASPLDRAEHHGGSSTRPIAAPAVGRAYAEISFSRSARSKRKRSARYSRHT